MWQGMHPQTRAMFYHVEYESDNWMNAFNLSVLTLHMFESVYKSFCPSSSFNHLPHLLASISETKDFLLKWTLEDHAMQTNKFRDPILSQGLNLPIMNYDGFHLFELVPGLAIRIPDFRIAYQEVSFHNTIHWFYSLLLSIIPKILKTGNSSIRDLIFEQLFHTPVENEASPKYNPEAPIKSDQMSIFLSLKDRNMLIFDYVIRTQSFLAQIKSGMPDE